MLKMVNGTGIIGVDMVCPLGGAVSPPQPPNYDKVEVEGVGSLMLPNSLEAPVERVELIGNSVQPTTTGKNLINNNIYTYGYLASVDTGQKISLNTEVKSSTTSMDVSSMVGENISISVQTKEKTGKKYAFTDETDVIINGHFDVGRNTYSKFQNIQVPQNAKKLYFSVTYDVQENTELQVELGAKVTTYEPYTGGKPSPSPEYPQEIKSAGKWNDEKQKYEVDVKITNAEQNWSKEQTLTLTSDRPLTKWDRLVEQGGQYGWLYGSKIYVVTGNEVFESRGGYNIESYTNRFFILNDLLKENDVLKPLAYMKCLRNVQYVYSPNIFEEGFETNINQFHIKLSNDRVGILASDDHAVRTAKFSGYMKKIHKNGNPIEILYATTDTVFFPLSQEEQTQLRNLHSYNGTTNIMVDSGEVECGIKLTYRKEI